jgi:hypothetical protein
VICQAFRCHCPDRRDTEGSKHRASRGRGWALWKALIIYASALHSDHAAAAEAKRVIDEVLTEYAESG